LGHPRKANGGRSRERPPLRSRIRSKPYFFSGAADDMEFVAGAAVVFAAVALVSAAVVVVVVVLLVSVAAGALVSAAVVLSAFFWQAERLTARTAAAATEVRIRMFMDCSPGGLSPDKKATHTRLREVPKS
jgi:hypothetical protein